MVSNDRGHDARYQRVVDAIDEYGPNDAWKQRAKVNVTPYYRAALNGQGPTLVKVDCGKCNRHDHSHNVFCQVNKKLNKLDIDALNKVKVVLRVLAAKARAEMSAVRQAGQ